jgi:hypothetical protein
MGWLSAFVEGQQWSSAQAEVYWHLRTAALDKDLRLKTLQAVDEQERTVMIRREFPGLPGVACWAAIDNGRKQG